MCTYEGKRRDLEHKRGIWLNLRGRGGFSEELASVPKPGELARAEGAGEVGSGKDKSMCKGPGASTS